MTHYHCHTNNCDMKDLPDDLPVSCVCASLAFEKIDSNWLDQWRAEKLRRDASSKTREAGMAALVRELGVQP